MQEPYPDFIFSQEKTGFDRFLLSADSQGCLAFSTSATPLGGAVLESSKEGKPISFMRDVPARLNNQRLAVQGVCATGLRLTLPWSLHARSGGMTKCKCIVPPNQPIDEKFFAALLDEGGLQALLTLASNPHLSPSQFDTLGNCPIFAVQQALFGNPNLPASLQSTLGPYLGPRRAFFSAPTVR